MNEEHGVKQREKYIIKIREAQNNSEFKIKTLSYRTSEKSLKVLAPTILEKIKYIESRLLNF